MSRSDERGAVAVFTAAVVVLLVMMAAFAVDLGMQRVVRSDVQALADVVALDAARVLDGRTAEEILDPSAQSTKLSLREIVEDSLERNDVTLGDVVSVDETLVFFDEGPNGEVVPQRDSMGVLVPVPDSAVPDGVLIKVQGEVDFAFAQVIGVESGGAVRSALADVRPFACMKIGSYAVGFSSADSLILNKLLSDLLGSTVTMRLLGYQGLARANFTLLDLLPFIPGGVGADQISIGTVDRVLNSRISVGELASAVLDASTAGDPSGLSAQASADLGELIGVVKVAGNAGLLDDVSLGTLLGVQQGQQAALGITINALDLLLAAIKVANGSYALTVEGLSFKTSDLPPGLGALGPTVELVGSAGVVPKPTMACGPEGTSAETAVVDLDGVGVSIDPNPSAFSDQSNGNPLPKLEFERVSATLNAQGVKSTALMSKIVCGAAADLGSVEGIDVAVASSLTGLTTSISPMTVRGKIKPNLAEVDLTIGLANPVALIEPSSGAPMSFRYPSMDYDEPLRFGSGNLVTGVVPSSATLVIDGTINVAGLEISVLDGVPKYDNVAEVGASPTVAIVLQFLKNSVGPAIVGGVVNPLLDVLNWFVAGPVSNSLGVKVAGADVFAVPRPSCDDVALRG